MSWNEPDPGRDPWNPGPGGKRGGQPSFDLEKLLRDLKARFGSRKRPGHHGPSGNLIGLLVAAVVVVWLLSGFYTVDAQDRAVVMRFGVVTGVQGPGLSWNPSWPIGSVAMVNVTKIRQATTQNTLMTRDHNLVDVGLTVQFRVSSARDYLFGVADPDDTLAQAARSALRSVVAGYDVDAVLGDAQREIADKTRSALQQTVNDYGSGIKVTDVSLSKVQPPDPVQDAFADAIKAGNDAASLENAAEAYAKDRLPRAQGQAAQEIAAAEAYRDQVEADAKGEVARFDALLADYRQAPDATRQRMYIDTLRTVLGHSRTVLVDTGKGGASIDLHLDAPPPREPAAGSGNETSMSPAPAASSQGDGDGPDSRSRNRGGSTR